MEHAAGIKTIEIGGSTIGLKVKGKREGLEEALSTQSFSPHKEHKKHKRHKEVLV